ncbi:TonB-dependent receptor [Weeksellaceae bacterium TAE3-ERU29]|nr:TonB-dependent receptor [Weeksellaceae bacterium TAE3-ERU29]
MKIISFFKRSGLFLFACINTYNAQAQEQPQDSTKNIIHLEDVIHIAPINHFEVLEQSNPLSAIDQILEGNAKINMVKRGAYAWEPNVDGFSSERLSVTIDGMQIFGACTDKMDPIPSYVETFNLGDVEIENGKVSAQGCGLGSVNLNLSKTIFDSTGLSGNISAGYETNNQQKVGSAGLKWNQERYYINSNFTYRKANNYYDGNNKEVLFSGFNKINLNLNAGYRINQNQSLHTSFIFDKATDVGYPALTMDVSLAKAFIGSVSFNHKKVGKHFTNWETKVYANSIEHKMDDTTRPNVAIHMDMPGWSKTFGMYSKINLHQNNHHFNFQLEGYQNLAKAEMTMYPNNPTEKIMFMYTWPDVETSVGSFYAQDKWNLKNVQLGFSGKVNLHNARIKSEFGKNSLKIFYPDFEGEKQRVLKNFDLSFLYKKGIIKPYLSLGYNERAPSVSESYGFYLFNSFDNYDYVGNPYLPNEKALYGLLKLKTKINDLSLNFEANHYHIKEYVIGKLDKTLSAMTIGANGVKIYQNLKYADLSNFYLNGTYNISQDLLLNAHVSYHLGKDNNGDNLPLISPIQYGTQLKFFNKNWGFMVHFHGNSTQKNYNPKYGEDSTKGFSLLDFSIKKQWKNIQINTSINNIFNTNYSTYTDWNNIPRMGRNIIINVNYKF